MFWCLSDVPVLCFRSVLLMSRGCRDDVSGMSRCCFRGGSVMWCAGDASAMSWPCLGLVVSQRCFRDVSVLFRYSMMSWWCFGHVSGTWFCGVLCQWCVGLVSRMLWWCVGDIWGLCQWCVNDVWVMSRSCAGGVSVTFQWCLGDVVAMSWWCLGYVSLCFMDVSVISRRCFSDSLAICQDVFSMC